MQQMSGHLKSIEKTVSSSHQEQMDRRNNSAQRLQEYKHEMMKINQDKDSLERLCYSLRDEVRDTSNKVETMSQDIAALDSNMRVQARLMDENTRRPHNLKNQPSNKTVSDMSSGERLALEGKIIKLNTTVQDIAGRLSVESRKREKIEHDLNVRVNDLLEELGTTKVEKDKELRDFDDKMKVLQNGFSVSEKQRIQMEISSVANELSRKMEEKEAKLRDDTVNKLSVIESTLNQENKRRSQKEKELENNFNKYIKELKVYNEEGNGAMKKVLDKHMEQTRARVGEVTSGLNGVEASLGEFRLMHDKVMTAEITHRQNSEKILDAKIEDLEDRMRCGLAALQSAVGDVGNTNNAQGSVPASRKGSREDTANLDELFKVQAENEDGIREQVAKDVSRLESRIANVETKVKQQNDQLDNKLQKSRGEDQEASSIMGDKMQQKIDSVIFSQERLKKQVDELENKVEDVPKNVSQLKDNLEGTEGRLSKKIEQERKERSQDVTQVRGDIERIIGSNERAAGSLPSLARLSQDVDETQTGMRKLAEAIHVVKSSLGNKIKDEKKIREQETKTLTRDLGLMDGKYKDLKERVKAVGRK
ncbi:uncharacterized protein LOC143022426 [Oratosquilla oratoria]|uniref:uncharacterized protein LOC143022426 n=1 Tax=Oratosquilla oratoria TaxID=337810 RepID=UPI003F7583AA